MSVSGQFQRIASEDLFSTQCTRFAGPDLPVFSQDWWIDLARGSSDYREVRVTYGNKLVGQLSYVLSRSRFGILRGCDPYWSHLGGPIVDRSLNRSQQADVVGSLLDQLPSRVSFSFVCDPTLSYANLVRDAFKNAGFLHSTQVTYLRQPGEGEVWSGGKSKHRGHIKRAAKNLECVDIEAADFVRFFERNLEAQGKISYAPLDSLTCLIKAAINRGCARAIAAQQYLGGEPRTPRISEFFDAAIVYLWDTARCYYWLSTRRAPSDDKAYGKPHPDATKLLLFRAMEHAQSMDLIFDADGVATPGADHLYRNLLGLRQVLHRDVFERVSHLDRLYQKCRQRFLTMVGSSLIAADSSR